MVLLSATKKVNQFLGPFLLRHGLRLQAMLSQGAPLTGNMDAWTGVSWAKHIITLESRDEADQAVEKALRQHEQQSWLPGAGGKSLFDSDNTDDSIDSKSSKSSSMSSPPLSLEDETAIRIQIFERYTRAALLPTETFADIQRWQFHSRLLLWARREYLLAQHRAYLKAAFTTSPELAASPQFSMQGGALRQVLLGKFSWNQWRSSGGHNNTHHDEQEEHSTTLNRLPRAATVQRLLRMDNWATTKTKGGRAYRMAQLAKQLGGSIITFRGGGWNIADIEETTSVSKLSLGESLELARGHVETCGPLNALCEEAQIFQLLTQEYVEALGRYLEKRSVAFDGETIVLDVGAGDGLLAQALRDYFDKSKHQEMNKKNSRKTSSGYITNMPQVIATDNYSWRISRHAEVEQLGYEATLDKYATPSNGEGLSRQVIVLCSWMPMGEDWTACFREYGVAEYILIGECDDGQCGENWLTWGNIHMRDDNIQNELNHLQEGKKEPFKPITATPLYKEDGYTRSDLNSVIPFQFSRYDSKVSRSGKTISFRRKA